MKITFKNKNLMAFAAMVKEGKNRGGIPKEIQLFPNEALDFIFEYTYLKSEVTDKKIKAKKNVLDCISITGDTETRFILSNKKLKQKEVKSILEAWSKNKITIKYLQDDIVVPLKIVKNPEAPKPKEPTKPESIATIKTDGKEWG